jgi:hypothetical protein
MLGRLTATAENQVEARSSGSWLMPACDGPASGTDRPPGSPEETLDRRRRSDHEVHGRAVGTTRHISDARSRSRAFWPMSWRLTCWEAARRPRVYGSRGRCAAHYELPAAVLRPGRREGGVAWTHAARTAPHGGQHDVDAVGDRLDRAFAKLTRCGPNGARTGPTRRHCALRIRPNKPLARPNVIGAASGNRTPDLRITRTFRGGYWGLYLRLRSRCRPP